MVVSQEHAYKTALDLGLVVSYCNRDGYELMRGSCTGGAARGDDADLSVRPVVHHDNVVHWEAEAHTVDGFAFLDLVG